MKQNLTLILLIIFVIQAIGQKEFVLNGQVIDNITKEPLPYSTIVDQEKMVGTTSNIDGYFSLSLINALETDSIIISYIGYKSIKTVISESVNNEIYKLEPLIIDVSEVVVNADKFNLKVFMKEVVTDYGSNRRDEPHIAIAHYREKAKLNGDYIMYLESIGYLVFASRQENKETISNYCFFCENTKCHVVNPQWIKYKKNRDKGIRYGFYNENVLIANNSNLNIFSDFENRGLLSLEDYKKYVYKIDSIYYFNNMPVFRIDFIGKDEQGSIHVLAESRQILKIKCTTNKLWSTPINKKVSAEINIQFNYYGTTPFVSTIESKYKLDGLEHFNSIEILLQKINKFELTWDEYWDFQQYNFNPYINYSPERWKAYNVHEDNDYNKIEKDLTSKGISLENQFINFSGRWFFTNIKWCENAKTKMSELKRDF